MFDRPRSFSTKLARPVPPEFEGLFVQHGWRRVEHVFGKRASFRYFNALGADRLTQARNAYLAEAPAGTRNGLPYNRW